MSPWRLVITDRFYTSVKLAMELLHRRIYLTGTIQTDRSGYARDIVTKKETKQVNKRRFVVSPQGTIKLAQNKRFPQITAAMSMDRTPPRPFAIKWGQSQNNHMRRVHGEMQPVPAPELVRDYHRWMGGVDVHDQLRMQRYSIQLSYKTRKYYKTLFLGLLDMALVNAFIVFRHHKKLNDERPSSQKRPPKHYAFFETLMVQLLAVDPAETYETIEIATAVVKGQRLLLYAKELRKSEQWIVQKTRVDTASRKTMVDNEQGLKKRQRSCKVCALYKSKPRKYTKYFCPECSTGSRRKYFCNVARGREKTCFAIWHNDWKNGNDIPRSLLQEHKLRDRPPAARPGKKRRRRLAAEEEEANENEDSDGAVAGDEA
ncbi:hypothetical protein PR003_g1172 [Phytophthora rubi]|uniref:PiggyBac transposable element-derived protein domain-containing protein n=1 Tax=Phytophthora rubi TaxID=129364 RepID=A0A6A3NP94_9STRA|nr:hypothetical protein PR002_g1145 [Phytophthora rubi]KAE9358631.1 hypothetical protein PR003_g1172 [Phytophthora rubi]